VSNRY